MEFKLGLVYTKKFTLSRHPDSSIAICPTHVPVPEEYDLNPINVSDPEANPPEQPLPSRSKLKFLLSQPSVAFWLIIDVLQFEYIYQFPLFVLILSASLYPENGTGPPIV